MEPEPDPGPELVGLAAELVRWIEVDWAGTEFTDVVWIWEAELEVEERTTVLDAELQSKDMVGMDTLQVDEALGIEEPVWPDG